MLGLTIALFIFRKEVVRLGNYGYLGTFFLSMFTNATIILPMPSILMIIPLGATFNPLYIGLVAGVGGAIGEMTAYVAVIADVLSGAIIRLISKRSAG